METLRFWMFCFLLHFCSFRVTRTRHNGGRRPVGQLSQHRHWAMGPGPPAVPSTPGCYQSLCREEGAWPLGLGTVTGVSLGPSKAVLCREQAQPSPGCTPGRPTAQKGGLCRKVSGFRFWFWIESRDTTLTKNMSSIPQEVLCQATLKNLLPSISSKSIFFFNKVPKYTFTQIIVVPKNPLQFLYI